MAAGQRAGLATLRHWCAKIARAYHFHCAREDASRWHLTIPAGVWLCQHCPQVTFDVARLRDHYAFDHA
jgi:ribosomal protein L37AE/L43A